MQDDETSKQTHTYIASHLDFLFANELVCVNITAKIRDELLGCKICDNTSNIILTTIYSEGWRMKEMSGETQNQGSVHYVLICKASTNGGGGLGRPAIHSKNQRWVIGLQYLW